jgi:TP901 family phage tail tape measure protein
MSKVRGGQVFVEIGADPRRLFKALGDLNKHIGKIGSQLSGLGTRMTAFGAALTAPLALATRQFAGFDDAIRATAAVSGASGAALQSLNDKARELGATTSFTAVQVANLMTELGRAGFRPDEIENMTGAVLDLARATGTDAALSAGIMAATLRQFGLGATDAARAADVLTKAANATFNTVEGLGESLKYAGPVAQSLGMSLEDTVAILGVLGNVGIQGSEAGTALRRLSVIAAGAGAELQKIFGVTNTDAAGNLKPLVDILDEINQVTAGMPVAERTAKMADAFGLLGITSANVLSSSADGVKGLAEQLRNAEGTAARTAKQMDAGLGGAMRIMLSAVEGVALAFGDALAPTLQAFIEQITNMAGGVTRFIQENQALIVSVTKGIATFVAVGAAITGMGFALSAVAAAFGLILSPIGAIVGAIALIGVAVDQATGVFGKLSETLSTTLSGMYEAIVDGDLSGAIDILWAGLYASWTRGVADLMSVVGPWVTFFQNTFTFLVANVLGIWDGLVDGIATMWDGLEATIRKSWNYVQSFFKGGKWLAEQNMAVENEMQARERERDLRRTDRMEEANQTADNRYRQAEVDQQARQQEAAAAESGVTSRSRSARSQRVQNEQFRDLLKSVEAATTIDQLRGAYEEFDALSANGRLTSGQIGTIETALEDAQERISKGMASMGGNSPSSQVRAGAGEAQSAAATSASEVVGTFSGAALGQLGFGQSLAQKQLDKLTQIEQNTSNMDGGLVTP